MSGIQQSLLMYGAAGAYQIANSLRFRSSASAYLNRTLASSGNRQTWTWSAWVKLGELTTNRTLFAAGDITANIYYNRIVLNTNGAIGFFNYPDSSNPSNGFGWLFTNNLLRDPSAWYHIVAVWDTTNATSTDRMRLYVNAVRVTDFVTITFAPTYPNQNTNSLINNSAYEHRFGRTEVGQSGANYFDGYLADINFIDGQALSPTAFGQYSPTTGVWIPASHTGTYGTNGFHLNFSNGTSTTTLGYDSSGNSNNWTTNNISLTAGSTYDWMIDSPTSFAGSSYGVGNYCVLNPLDKTSDITTADANLTCNQTGNDATIRGTIGMSSGKWYWEATLGNLKANLGIAKANASLSSYLGSDANGWGYYSLAGTKVNNGATTAYGAIYTVGDTIGIAFDADAGTLTFYKNNVSQGVAFTGLTSGPYFAAQGTSVSLQYFNFGQRPFAYTPPSGYKSLCTQNLTTPTVPNGANYMAATTYTGTNATQTISNAVNGVIFQPDFIWIKNRSVGPTYHALQDTVRGTLKMLESNATNAETTYTQTVTGVLANGFTLGDNSDGYSVNQSGYNYIGWQWKAGGTAVTNTAGSITSQVSANTTAGFSVVTYTGTGANATVGHGLGVAPSMVIVKARANATGWVVGHAYLNAGSSPWNYYLSLESTAAQGSTNLTWNNTAPTSSVFSLGSGSGTNPASTMVAYCFAAIAGYSTFGSYTGNGSADGPFVYCGFRPRWVMVKKTSSVNGDWVLVDTSRGTYNVVVPELYADLSQQETNSSFFDILSNGFKARATGQQVNASGDTYIYAAFCEVPFNFALGR